MFIYALSDGTRLCHEYVSTYQIQRKWQKCFILLLRRRKRRNWTWFSSIPQKSPWRWASTCSTSTWTCGATTDSSGRSELATTTSASPRTAPRGTKSMICWRTGCRSRAARPTSTACWTRCSAWTSGARPRASPRRPCSSATTSTQKLPERPRDGRRTQH